MAHPLFISFSRYVWPYPPGPVFFGLLGLALVVQIFLVHKVPRLRRLLPVVGALILVGSIPAGFLIPPQRGVFLGEIDTIFTVALPGAALLLGSGAGWFSYWFYQYLK